MAKNIVAAKLAHRCEVQLAYAIGIPNPVSIKVDTFGTGKINDEEMTEIIPTVFNLTPSGIIQMLDLKRPIYRKTAFGGHFGRHEKEFAWENTDRTDILLAAVANRLDSGSPKEPFPLKILQEDSKDFRESIIPASS